LDRASVF